MAVKARIPCIQRNVWPWQLELAEREPAGVNIHLGDADEPQRGRESEPRGDGTLEQQVRQLVLLLQAKGGVVEHPAVQVARLLDLQLVDVAAEPHELPGELLVLQTHVWLGEEQRQPRKNDISQLNPTKAVWCQAHVAPRPPPSASDGASLRAESASQPRVKCVEQLGSHEEALCAPLVLNGSCRGMILAANWNKSPSFAWN